MSTPISDVIDHLAGIAPGSRLDAIRGERQVARENAQRSYLSLFAPDKPGAFALRDRFALAAFVAGLHRETAITDFYLEGLSRHDGGRALAQAVTQEIARGATQGPYGHYPAGPLSAENQDGPVYRVAETGREALGAGLAAAFVQAHMLVFHPRDASREALQALLDAGLTTTSIVTLSQLVAFLSFQIRTVLGLRVLAAA